MPRSIAALLTTLALLAFGSGTAVAGKGSNAKTTASTTAVATTTSTSTPPADPPAPVQYFGFNDNAVGFGQVTPLVDADLASQAGATASRITFDWRYAEPTQGTWNIGNYDAIYNRDLAKGIKPVFILLFSPQWALEDPSVCPTVTQACRYAPGPSHLDAWRNAVTKLVTRYPQMAALEIWNEPNLDIYWKGGLDPAYYTRLLAEAHNAVAAAGSSVPVLGGALANAIDADTASTIGYRSYLKSMYAAGAKGAMDGISIHAYPEDIDLWRFFKVLTEVRDVRDSNGDNVPLWVTETGITTYGNTGGNYSFNENDQAFTLAQIYSELTKMKDVRAALFHTLIDPVGLSPVEAAYGAMRGDLTPKPAYCTFASLRQTTYACPSTVPAVSPVSGQKLRWKAQDYVQAAADAARTWYASHGTYVGLSPTQLHAIDPTLSATGSNGTLAPGATADPSRVGVWVFGTAGAESLLLCNTSQADRSYCIQTQAGNPWTYGSAVGNVNAAAGATTNGTSWWW